MTTDDDDDDDSDDNRVCSSANSKHKHSIRDACTKLDFIIIIIIIKQKSCVVGAFKFIHRSRF